MFRASFFAHRQKFSTVHSGLVSFIQVSDDRFQAESGWNRNLHETYSDECTVEDARNM